MNEKRDNVGAIADLISELLSDVFVCGGVRPFLNGFNTEGSAQALQRLKNELVNRGIVVDDLKNKDEIWTPDVKSMDYVPDTDFGVFDKCGIGFRVATNYLDGIYKFGRAIANDVWTDDGSPVIPYVNCIQIDNNDNAVLNYTYSEQIAGRSLQTVMGSLIAKATR